MDARSQDVHAKALQVVHAQRMVLGVKMLFILVVVAVVSGCSTAAREYCAAAAECEDTIFLLNTPIDGVGTAEDSEAICVIDTQTQLDALRANRESICHDLAEALEEFYLCAAEERGCGPWNGNACRSRRERIAELRNDAGNRCSE